MSMSDPAARSFRRCCIAGGIPALLLFAMLLCEGHPSLLFAQGPFSSDFYDSQADMLLAGRLDMPAAQVGIEGIERNGRTYVYWGIVPSVLRLPIAALTERLDGHLTRVAQLVAFPLALVASGWLLWLARNARPAPLARDERVSIAGFVFLVGACSPLLFLASRPLVYHEAELWGAAFALCGFGALIRWCEAPSGMRLAWASALATLAFNTRASVGAGPVAALALALAIGLVRRQPARALWARALAVAIPIGVYAAINFARFGSAFHVPLRDQVFARLDPQMQAALAANDGTLFGLRFLPTTLLQYLRPDAIRPWRLFPFLTFRRPIDVLGGATFHSLDETSSLVTAAPALCLLALLGLRSVLRAELSRGWLLACAGAMIATIPPLTFAAVANRYLADLLPAAIVPAAAGVPHLVAMLRARPALRTTTVAAVGVLALWAVLANGALGLQSQRLLLLPASTTRRDFVALQYELDARLFGGSPPDVTSAATLARDATVGSVAIVGDCEGLYWKDRYRWYALERGDGDRFRRLLGTPTPGRAAVVKGRQWEIATVTEGGTVRFEYLADVGVSGTGPAVAIPPGQPVEIEVVNDPGTAEVKVFVHGKVILDLWLVEARGPVVVDPSWTIVPFRAPLCDRLRIRLDAVGPTSEPRMQ
jgi:hypothetical protein